MSGNLNFFQEGLKHKKIGIAVGTHNSEEKIGYEGWGEINISDKLNLKHEQIKIKPKFKPDLNGIHHLHQTRDSFIIDFLKFSIL